MKKFEKIEKNVLRKQISSRGGGIEISLDAFGFKGEKMAAYQNSLGGGLLGRICVNDTITSKVAYVLTDKQEAKLLKLGEQLMRYFHFLTNPDSEFESMTFEENQNMPKSAY